ncbi:hypothetical protein [Leifsonia aquatica]|uniref:hypothetical protein n=1 Tax=Leifsonia aquatica TaxID=144185 RepID=UPI0013B3F569|nr:hypothetical protein [Leifsonia aquatica]
MMLEHLLIDHDQRVSPPFWVRPIVHDNPDTVQGRGDLKARLLERQSGLVPIAHSAQNLDSSRREIAAESGVSGFSRVRGLHETERTETSALVRVLPRHKEDELSDLANPNVPRFDQFKDDIKALNNWDRVMYQDDSTTDPSQAFTAPPDSVGATQTVQAPASLPPVGASALTTPTS